MTESDRQLGMDRKISRRDFLNGVAVGVGGLLAADPLLAALTASEGAPEKSSEYYPPALTGMRGNHDGSFAFAHRLRDGEPWDSEGAPAKTGETYDLVVVGGGISG
ncbi:MAG TPA: twin-arginine translocation signal domain-containing protein, partial [Terriglobales bacterium]|nr:twin-arginine translocation signal domain-containing protein [Terriglobales bacterium]